jgi:uncharacterized membrane protein YcaP (DUF421 family)
MDQLMDRLFDLAMPWWEFVIRAVAVYVVVLIMVRIVGKRTVGQYTPFDLIVVVLLGTAVQNSLIGEDQSLLGGLILAATLLSLNWGVGFLSARSRRFDRLVEGHSIVLARDGIVDQDQLRRQSISEEDFRAACRSGDCCEHSEIALAILESSGNITVIKRRQRAEGAAS